MLHIFLTKILEFACQTSSIALFAMSSEVAVFQYADFELVPTTFIMKNSYQCFHIKNQRQAMVEQNQRLINNDKK